MGKRRTLDRRALRDNFEAAEARERGQRAPGEEGADYEEPEAEAEAEVGGEEEAAPAVVKKKKVVKETKPRKSRATKQAPQKVVWIVFDNSNKPVGEPFPYPKKQEAEELAARLQAEKKSTHFVQPVRKALDE
jgi:hypothetical protein